MTISERQREWDRAYKSTPHAKEKHRIAEKARMDRLSGKLPPKPVVELPVPVIQRPKKEVVAEYNYMLNQAKVNDWSPKCETQPQRYVLYEATPTTDYAETLCAGCPMLALCAEYAEATRPGWGVWGGVAYVDGKPYVRSARQERMVAA